MTKRNIQNEPELSRSKKRCKISIDLNKIPRRIYVIAKPIGNNDILNGIRLNGYFY
jgi:hypothetical protein